jgi:S-adenosylmethionine:tRNA ribosyltransferase-isomerase
VTLGASDFDYELPAERIAQRPAARRDDARMLVLDRESGRMVDARFRDLPQRLRAGDLLVLNDTRVVPSRLFGRKESGGRIELLLVERVADAEWSCLARAARAPSAGARIELPHGLRATVSGRTGDRFRVRLEAEGGDPAAIVAAVAGIPLPPYIARPEPADPDLAALDRERYQTVYAREPGAVAAPTAGLHFTRETLDALGRAGVRAAFLTLHVGPGTFQPLRTERIEEHVLGAERFMIPDETARAIDEARGRGGRIVAVGTTVVRTLEHRARPDASVEPGSGSTDLFIRPGHTFRVVDQLLTNFHLPRSTLLMLVCAFAGRERVLAAYDRAIALGYRFYSYGDAMLVGSTE